MFVTTVLLFPFTLISLGYLMRCGAVYGSDPARPRTHVLLRVSPDGPLLATLVLSATNMLPVLFPALARATAAIALAAVDSPQALVAEIDPQSTFLRRADSPLCGG